MLGKLLTIELVISCIDQAIFSLLTNEEIK